MANIVMLTHWTGGDVYPFIRIGRRLRERGHAVTLITHCAYADAARQAGIEFAALDTPEEWAILVHEEMPRQTALMDDLRNITQAIEEHRQEDVHFFTYEQMGREYELVKQHCRRPDTVLVARHGSGGAGLLAAEELDLPIISLFIAPAMAIQPLMDEALIGEILLANINDIRAKLDFPPIRSWRAWVNAAHRNIGMWPDWFAAPEPTWEMEITPVGFSLDREQATDTGELPRELQNMLRSGEQAVLITGGTGKIVRSDFYAACVGACRLLGCPAVLATQYRDLVPDDLPDHIKWFRYLPFAQIMPFMGAVIHHGGIGTIGQAMLAGIPQLVLAHGMDRPDNAFRLKHFGGAEALTFMKWKPDLIAKALQSLMTPEVRECCAILGHRLRDDDALARATEVIESALYDQKAHISSVDFLAAPASGSQSGPGIGTARAGEQALSNMVSPTARVSSSDGDRLSNLTPEQLAALVRRLHQKKDRG